MAQRSTNLTKSISFYTLQPFDDLFCTKAPNRQKLIWQLSLYILFFHFLQSLSEKIALISPIELQPGQGSYSTKIHSSFRNKLQNIANFLTLTLLAVKCEKSNQHFFPFTFETSSLRSGKKSWLFLFLCFLHPRLLILEIQPLSNKILAIVQYYF